MVKVTVTPEVLDGEYILGLQGADAEGIMKGDQVRIKLDSGYYSQEVAKPMVLKDAHYLHLTFYPLEGAWNDYLLKPDYVKFRRLAFATVKADLFAVGANLFAKMEMLSRTSSLLQHQAQPVQTKSQ